MTPNPVTITPETSFPEAFRILREKGIRHLPVVDKQGRLVGIIARTDLLHASPSKPASLSFFEMTYLLVNLHVREVVSNPPITVSADHPLEQAARVMVQKEIGNLAASS